MSDNIPEKGAALQRDMETYAIIPYLPGGFISVEDLKKMVIPLRNTMLMHSK